MQVSIIIPTLNEAENIERVVTRLRDGGGTYLTEILVIDAGSADNTVQLAKQAGARVFQSPQRGRARQMNYGAAQATGELLYFVHGDTLPPPCYMQRIQRALREGYPSGCFWFEFDRKSPLLSIHNWLTHLPYIWCRGGDQSLFVTRAIFEELGGYRDDYLIMEEYEFLQRSWKKYPFRVIPKAVQVSTRKYDHNPYLRVQLANITVFTMFRLGCSQQRMVNVYKGLLAGQR